MATRIAAAPNPKRVREQQIDAALARLTEIAATAYVPMDGTTVSTLRTQASARLDLLLGMVQDEARVLRALVQLARDDYTAG